MSKPYKNDKGHTVERLTYMGPRVDFDSAGSRKLKYSFRDEDGEITRFPMRRMSTGLSAGYTYEIRIERDEDEGSSTMWSGTAQFLHKADDHTQLVAESEAAETIHRQTTAAAKLEDFDALFGDLREMLASQSNRHDRNAMMAVILNRLGA